MLQERVAQDAINATSDVTGLKPTLETRYPHQTQRIERRICFCLCPLGPNRSFIRVLLRKRTPGPKILIFKRSCSPDSLARPQTLLVCNNALICYRQEAALLEETKAAA